MADQPAPDEVEEVARAIRALRSCTLEWNNPEPKACQSCRNAKGYHDDVGCITLARAAIATLDRLRRAPPVAVVEDARRYLTEIVEADLRGVCHPDRKYTRILSAVVQSAPPKQGTEG